MNSTTIQAIRKFQRTHLHQPGTVLDVGSMNVGCKWSGKDFWTGWQYTGLDIAPGSNVDIVVNSESFDINQQFDVVISCNALEHTERPWKVFESMARHVKPGGHLFAFTPWVFRYHAFPIDCWRISPDAYKVLCRDNNLNVVESYINRTTVWQQRSIAGILFTLWTTYLLQVREHEAVLIAQKPR